MHEKLKGKKNTSVHDIQKKVINFFEIALLFSPLSSRQTLLCSWHSLSGLVGNLGRPLRDQRSEESGDERPRGSH